MDCKKNNKMFMKIGKIAVCLIFSIFLLISIINAAKVTTIANIDQRKYFKYYIGIKRFDNMKVMLVAGKNEDGSVKTNFTKKDILDINNYYKKGIYFINEDGKINEYNNNEDKNQDIVISNKPILDNVLDGWVGIYTVEDLNNIRNDMSGKYILIKI